MGDPSIYNRKKQLPFTEIFQRKREPPTAVHDNTGDIGIVKVAIITSL